MAQDTTAIREFSTEPIDFQLLADDTAIDLSGVDHVEMEMRDKKGKRYSYSSSDSPAYISIVTTTEGKVRFSPPNERIFLATGSPYTGYWKVYSDASTHYSVPEDKEFTIKV